MPKDIVPKRTERPRQPATTTRKLNLSDFELTHFEEQIIQTGPDTALRIQSLHIRPTTRSTPELPPSIDKTDKTK